MTPKAKAIELYNKYMQMPFPTHTDRAKRCALIAVDEIIEALGYKSLSDSPYTTLEARQYYVQVKQEIDNL